MMRLTPTARRALALLWMPQVRAREEVRTSRHFPPRKPRNPAGHWSPDRDRGTQARFRRMLINRDGLICRRCGATDVELQAHHTSPTDGRLLCRPCHKAEDPHAR